MVIIGLPTAQSQLGRPQPALRCNQRPSSALRKGEQCEPGERGVPGYSLTAPDPTQVENYVTEKAYGIQPISTRDAVLQGKASSGWGNDENPGISDGS